MNRSMSMPVGGAMTGQSGRDLMQIGFLRRLLLWPGFPYLFQLLFLVVFVVLAVGAWGLYPPEGVNARLYARTNLVNLLIWGLWWPAMVWGAVLFGRVWCTVCPLELVANASERLGRGLGLNRFRLPGWLAAGGLVLALYFLIQMFVAGVQLHRIPAYGSWFLWLMLAAALWTGLFLRDRAFCRGFCPVALLLNAYGRGGMLAVRPRTREACQGCAGRECVAETNRQPMRGRSCPSLLNPARLDRNNDCLVCGQCLKACAPGNMQLLLRRPFSAADWREAVAGWPVTLFVMMVSGFVIYELCTEWKAAADAFKVAPAWFTAWSGAPPAAGGWLQGLWTLVVLPLALWLVLGLLTRASGGASSLTEAWRRLALPMAVIVAAGHMAKGLAKFMAWGGFLPEALREPAGIQTALQIQAKTMPSPAAWLSLEVIAMIGAGLIVAAIGFAIREARLAEPDRYRRRLLPLLLLGGFYLYLVLGWGWQGR